MEEKDVKIGQIWVWPKSSEYQFHQFQITDIDDSGKITWWCLDNSVSYRKTHTILDMVNNFNCGWAKPLTPIDSLKPPFTSKKFKFQ